MRAEILASTFPVMQEAKSAKTRIRQNGMTRSGRMKFHSKLGRVFLAFSLIFFYVPDCAGYSILTHEAIIDAAWKDNIEPLLLKRFPDATPEDLLKAHAYVYGGAIIQDLGYYPFGNRFFSDLTHYVRSGDFVLALIEESRDLNEYAFALGALAHYAADNSGHRLATNLSVAILYPGLAHKYGPAVTYEDKPSAHMKVEYGFDVDQVAKGHYAPKASGSHRYSLYLRSGDIIGAVNIAPKSSYALS
jgi:Zinc dependent phospholipase C